MAVEARPAGAIDVFSPTGALGGPWSAVEGLIPFDRHRPRIPSRAPAQEPDVAKARPGRAAKAWALP